MKSTFGDKESIQKGERTPIGYYRHNGPKPIVETRRDFETASYSETTEVPPGIYPIYPGWSTGRHNGEATAYVEFKGKVTNDYFPSSFGGVPIGETKPKYIGEDRITSRRINISEAIAKTGNSPNNTPDKDGEIPPDIYVDPKCWDDVIAYLEKTLHEDINYFKTVVKDLDDGKKSIKELAGTIKYCGACINQTSSALDKVQMSKGYLKDRTFSELRKKNTRWVPVPEMKEKDSEAPEIGH
jgi:hypothetical protein